MNIQLYTRRMGLSEVCEKYIAQPRRNGSKWKMRLILSILICFVLTLGCAHAAVSMYWDPPSALDTSVVIYGGFGDSGNDADTKFFDSLTYLGSSSAAFSINSKSASASISYSGELSDLTFTSAISGSVGGTANTAASATFTGVLRIVSDEDFSLSWNRNGQYSVEGLSVDLSGTQEFAAGSYMFILRGGLQSPKAGSASARISKARSNFL